MKKTELVLAGCDRAAHAMAGLLDYLGCHV